MLKIFGAPGRYIQGAGALDALGGYAALFGRRAALVIDRYVQGVLGPRIEALCGVHGVALTALPVEGDITPESIAALRAQAAAAGVDMVIAVGGGKALDAGKAVAKAEHCHLVTVPTVASNDAPHQQELRAVRRPSQPPGGRAHAVQPDHRAGRHRRHRHRSRGVLPRRPG
ncbi:iron-containing alcohol dehydrogenase [Achromobacter xylosoxidans]|uniref:iron-containing alcohol dehydrogenase n=1 Tax=Alcaligenes xylosoxydans xylosoxydans TaxID=85698 RepID=UPI0023B00CC2|nr:iron-containing alcohol dehydrogenase [Achromobacter xylosoxidans]